MKLIDILVQELPKRGGWPDGAVCITQDADGSICTWGAAGVFFRGHWQHPSGKSLLKYWYREGFKVIEDYATTIITREQYEDALTAAQQSVWDGTGLPPVGVECEGKQFAQLNWTKFKVVAVENGHVFGFWNDSVSAGLDSQHWEFRPIRSEAERKRDESIEALHNNLMRVKYKAEEIYNAIAEGKIPGIKLEKK